MKLSVTTSGIPGIGSESSPLRKWRSLPARSVIRIDASGRKARLHGFSRPRVSTLTRIGISAVWYSIGPSGRGGTGMPPPRCANAEVATTVTATAATANLSGLCNMLPPNGRIDSMSFHARIPEPEGRGDAADGRHVRSSRDPSRMRVDLAADLHDNADALVHAPHRFRSIRNGYPRGARAPVSRGTSMALRIAAIPRSCVRGGKV